MFQLVRRKSKVVAIEITAIETASYALCLHAAITSFFFITKVFILTLRSLGVNCRLVMSFQPIPLKPLTEKQKQAKSKKIGLDLKKVRDFNSTSYDKMLSIVNNDTVTKKRAALDILLTFFIPPAFNVGIPLQLGCCQ